MHGKKCDDGSAGKVEGVISNGDHVLDGVGDSAEAKGSVYDLAKPFSLFYFVGFCFQFIFYRIGNFSKAVKKS